MLIVSSLGDLSRNTIPVRVANVSKNAKVIKKSEMLAVYTPTTCINSQLQSIYYSQSINYNSACWLLKNKLLQITELNDEQRRAAEK